METWRNSEDTKALLKFIIKQKLDLEDYNQLVDLIEANFLVYKKGKGITDCTDELVDAIIDWEKGHQTSSLEKLITDNFVIYDIQ